MNFYEIVNAECKKNRITITELLRQIGLSSANTGAWKNGGFPRVDNLIEISDILNVSIDYLLGREETKKEPTILTYSGNERIDSITKEILKTDLTDEDLKLIEFILDKYKR